MAHSRAAKMARPPSRSRFQEGSMNDRASAAPPVHFIGPDARMSLDKPDVVMASVRAVSCEEIAPLQKTQTQFERQQQQPQQEKDKKEPEKQAPTGKRNSKQLFGQVWTGMREKLGIKRASVTTTPAPAPEKVVPEKKQPPTSTYQPDERPSRDEIYANYHQLVASGFFSAHAIQSTRQPAPGTRPSTSAGPAAASSTRPQFSQPCPDRPAPLPPSSSKATPLWPLPQEPLTPRRNRLASPPVRSPASASSRGTKRAVEDAEDEENDLLGHRKLRKTASATRELAIPKLRSSSRLAAARSFSNAHSSAAGTRAVSSAAQQNGNAQREPNKLTKRVLNRLPLQVPDRGSSARRSVSQSATVLKPQRSSQDVPMSGTATEGTERVLRPRRSAAEPLRVRPDANRGIPSVPNIPSKFTYGEDRENDGPWRGLRRNNANTSFYNP